MKQQQFVRRLFGVPILVICCSLAGIIYVFSHSTSTVSFAFAAPYQESIENTDTVREFTITASRKILQLTEEISVDSYTYNGTVPGPELRIQLGDTVRVPFTNHLPDETTIHWHGVRVENAMDGVPGVTQDPIQPGETFVYEFTPKDTGTFWFHPHVRGSEQLERGLYGTLIVEDPDDPRYDQDMVWTLDDWRITQDGKLDDRFNTSHDLMHDGRWGNVVTVSGEVQPILTVDPGTTVLLRLVNTANGRIFAPHFGGLNTEVVAVDGMPVEKTFAADGFELAPGNRIDVRIEVPTTALNKTYAVRDVFVQNTYRIAQIVVSDVVVSSEVKSSQIKELPDWSNAWNAPLTAEYVLDAERVGGMGMMNIAWTMNGNTFPNGDVFTFEKEKFAKIRFTNDSGRLHPMHVHGQFFRVLTRNGQVVDEPFLRDTVLVNGHEEIEIGMVPLDIGDWAMHCHIQEHAEAGMMTTFKVE